MSSEELASKTEEAMTGRKFTYTLFAPSFSELAGIVSISGVADLGPGFARNPGRA